MENNFFLKTWKKQYTWTLGDETQNRSSGHAACMYCGGWKNNFPSLLNSPGRTNAQITTGQIIRRKWPNGLFVYIQGTGGLRTHWAGEACMAFWTKERKVESGTSKGKVGRSQAEEKEQTCEKPILAGPPRTMGHGGKTNGLQLVPSCVPHLVSIVLSVLPLGK